MKKAATPKHRRAGPHAVLRSDEAELRSAVIERHQLSFDALTALEAFALNLFSPNDLKKTLPRSLVRRRLRAKQTQRAVRKRQN